MPPCLTAVPATAVPAHRGIRHPNQPGLRARRAQGTPRRGLSASLARTIEALCKLPDGQQRVTRGTRLKRLRAYLGAHPRVNRLIPIPTLCLQLQRERRGLTSAPDTSVQANLRAARARYRATLCLSRKTFGRGSEKAIF